MRTTLILLLIFFSVCSAFSQDVLYYRNGDEVKAKVLEVNTADIKYKKWDNQSGPTYTVLKSELFMVKYENGQKDVFKEETPTAQQPAQPQNVDAAVQNALKEKEKQESYGRNMKIFRNKLGKGIGLTSAGAVCLFTGIPLIAYGTYLDQVAYLEYDPYYDIYYTNYYDGSPYWGVGAVLVAASIPMLIIGPIQLAKAFKYRRMAKSGTSLAFEPMFSPMRSQLPMSMAPGYASGMTLKFKF